LNCRFYHAYRIKTSQTHSIKPDTTRELNSRSGSCVVYIKLAGNFLLLKKATIGNRRRFKKLSKAP
jgi:hypothetical protein